MSRRRGFSLVEALVALTMSGVLLAASGGALLATLRRSSAQRARRLAWHNVRAAATVLAAELRDISPGEGDILSAPDTAVTLRAIRAFSIVCEVRPPDAVVVADSLTYALRALDPSRDSVLLYKEGDPLRSDDDAWVSAGAVAAAADRCPGGSAGTRVTLRGADVSALGAGAPLRTFEILDYRLYRDAAGDWWLGVRGPDPPGWAATSPIAGPLSARVGLGIRLLGADGLAAPAGSARIVEVTVRGAPGPRGAPADTALARLPFRND